jgi:hypothetical protein
LYHRPTFTDPLFGACIAFAGEELSKVRVGDDKGTNVKDSP